MIKIINLKCEYKKNPIGIDIMHPRFSWEIESDGRNIMQEAYRIQVSLDENDFDCPLWDSGEVKSDQSVHVKYEGPQLKPDTFYYWNVNIRTNSMESAVSETMYLQTGLLNPNDWVAKWIEPSNKTSACPILRKEFELKKTVSSARAYVSGVGLYELRINGQKVGNDYLTPGWTSYHKRIQYQTYDITNMLQEKNAVGIILADGWYKGHMTWNNKENLYGDNYAALVQLNITYEDGESKIIASDYSWKWSESEILSAEIYHGEHMDLRRAKEGWDRPGYEGSNWKKAVICKNYPNKLIGQINTPVRIMEEIKPIEIFTTPKGEVVVDMGQNIAGIVKLEVKGKAGDKIVLRHFEVLSDEGNVSLDNLVHAQQKDEYILSSDGFVCLQPRFTFHGFRYIYLEEFPYEANLNQFTGLVMYSDMETTGCFETSDQLINKLQENIMWSQKGNFVDIPSDCPQRSERLGWTGDVQIYIKTAAFNMACASFFTKWLGDVKADQESDGLIPWVVPNIMEKEMYPKLWLEGTGQEIPSSAGWGDVAVIAPWVLYMCYGDKTILEKQYDSMKAWVEYIRAQGENEFLWNTGFHFGDWLSLDTNTENVFGGTSHDFVATAFYANSTEILSRAARILGKKQDYDEYHLLHQNIIKEFRNEFITNTGRVTDNTQTAQVLALHFGLVEEKHRQKTVDRLEELIRRNGYKINTGFLGTPYFCYALSENGKQDIAMKVLLQQECPSWLYEVVNGATTIWEYWDNDKRNCSYNHYAFGSIGEWMYSVLGGINIDEEEPGYKHIVISPLFAKEFDFVKTEIKTMYGLLKCNWERNAELITMDLKIPHNTHATVCFKKKAGQMNIMINGEKTEDAVYDKEKNSVKLNLGSGNYIIKM